MGHYVSVSWIEVDPEKLPRSQAPTAEFPNSHGEGILTPEQGDSTLRAGSCRRQSQLDKVLFLWLISVGRP